MIQYKTCLSCDDDFLKRGILSIKCVHCAMSTFSREWFIVCDDDLSDSVCKAQQVLTTFQKRSSVESAVGADHCWGQQQFRGGGGERKLLAVTRRGRERVVNVIAAKTVVNLTWSCKKKKIHEVSLGLKYGPVAPVGLAFAVAVVHVSKRRVDCDLLHI